MIDDSPASRDQSRVARRSRRRWLRFSLRTLLLVMLFAGVGAKWMAVKAHRQRAAVAALKKEGGFVFYDYQFDTPVASLPPDNVTPPGPAWLRGLLGDDFFTNVTYASAPTDEAMKCLVDLSELQTFVARNPYQITDAGIESLKGHDQLVVLFLMRTKITDRGLGHLAGLHRVEQLMLSDTQIGDVGLAQIRNLARLRILYLSNTAVTDEGLENLKGLNQLGFLSIESTRVTTQGAARIQKALPNCVIRY